MAVNSLANLSMKRATFIVFLLGMSVSVSSAANCPLSLKVAFGSAAGPNLSLSFVLDYKGNKPVVIYKSDLPWGARGAIDLHLYAKDRPGRPLNELGYIADSVPDTIRLEPNHEYKGAINLAARYQDIQALHSQSDIVVKWSYTLRPTKGNPLAIVSGILVIPKAN